MVTPEVISFVRHSKDRGFDDKGIFDALKKQGWQDADIHEAFLRSDGQEAPDRRGSLLVSFAAVIMLFAFWPAGLVLMWAGTGWPKKVKITVTVLPFLLFVLIVAALVYIGTSL